MTESGAVLGEGAAQPQRDGTPPRSGPPPVRLLRVCLDNRVLGGVEVSETSTLTDVRESIAEDEIQGVPENYVFLFGGAPVTRRQEARRRALACFSAGFLTIVVEGALIEQPPPQEAPEARRSSNAAAAAGADDTPAGRDGASSASGAGGVSFPAAMMPEGAAERTGGEGLELHFTDGPLEGTMVLAGEDGVRIGRHTSNSLVIPEAGISRYHCEIRYVDGCFCVRDLGSVTGTFFYLRPHGRLQLFAGLMVKLGETELQVLEQGSPGGGQIDEQVVHFFEGPFAGHKVTIPAGGISIGRRHDNDLVLNPDGTVSSHHAAIFSEEGHFYISDLGSCNGTCIRLSPERTDSDWHPIIDGDVLGAGCTKILCRMTPPVQ